ncbi:MAG: Trk system potassium transporter TrkA [Pseudomonadota bacterium]|nr:Trk system potassium transporter TrkA [Pseudomonadota bacterium]
MLNAIVVGAGEVGISIAQNLSAENHNVVMIDSDAHKLQQVLDVVDVQIVEGVGSHPDVLEQAGADRAHLIIAVTQSDEVNMIACQVAHSLFGINKKIARVRDMAYLNITHNRLYNREDMPVDVVISPEKEVADAVVRAAEVSGAFDVTYMADSSLCLIGVKIPHACTYRGIKLREVLERMEYEFRIMSIFRNERIIYPRGEDHLEENDEVYLLCKTNDRNMIMEELGYMDKPMQDVMIIGGGHIGYEIALQMEHQGVNIRIVENNIDRANYLAHHLNHAVVLHGDALDSDLLVQENISSMDAVFVMTSNDPSNILSSISARKFGVENIITRVSSRMLMPLADTLRLDKVISPREITASRILQHVRRSKSRVEDLHTIHQGRLEVMELKVTYNSPSHGRTVGSLGLSDGVKVSAVLKGDGSIIFADAHVGIEEGDTLIMVSRAECITEIEQMV